MLVSNIEKWLTKSKIFAIFLVSFIIGIFICEFVKFTILNIEILLFSTVFLIIIAITFRRDFLIKIFAITVITFFAGILYYLWFYNSVIPKKSLENTEVEFVGHIVEEPIILRDKNQLVVKIEEVAEQKLTTLTGQKVLVENSLYPIFNYGDKVKASGILTKPQNYDTFNYQKYLMKDKIFLVITDNTNVELINLEDRKDIKYYLYKIKNSFKSRLEKIFSEPYSSLASGLIIGAKNNFSPQLKNDMNATGTTHIVVISGQNMEIISKVFVELTRSFSRYVTFWGGAIFLFLFAILTGASASVVRAAVLASLFLLARFVSRRKQIIIPLIFTAFVMILLNPFILRFDLGFQLSFAAMLGLIFITPLLDNWLIKWPKVFRESFSATLGAQLFTAPITLYSFGRVSLLAPITNALILLAVPWAMATSFIVGIIGIIWLPLGQLLGWFAWPLLKYIILIIELFAKIPWNSINYNLNSWVWVAGYYLLLVILIFLANKKRGESKTASNCIH
ncbi:MAG: ComEC family competence protein [Patescibacteria group bacterium]|nr:ComEC family competence protein [Patescibacteria group bacterium]